MIDYERRLCAKHEALGLECFIAAALVGTAIAGVAGAGVSAVGASSAAGAQEQAANQADQTQLQMYNQTRDDQAPYRQAGYQALSTIGSDMSNQTGFATPFSLGSFMSDPGYQFTLGQGQTAVNNAAASQGGVLNGGTLKALDSYTTGLANSTYGDAYNRYLQTSNMQYNQLAGIAGIGQNSLSTTATAGTNTANAVSQTQQYAGNARASGYVGVGNAINGGLSTAANAGQTYGLLNTLGYA